MNTDRNIINNRYRIIEKLGEGGMGAVYLVQDVLLAGKPIALKSIKEELLNEFTLKIFKKEFEVMTRLKHPNLARVYDFGYDKVHENYFLTMDYIQGESLREILETKQSLDVQEKLRIMVSLLRTLEFIHTRNILHRDIKPGNIMIMKNEELRMNNGKNKNNSSLFIDHYSLKLMDFGLADLGREDVRRSKGTLLYMAPEVLKGEIDKRVDIFATGVTCLEFFTGKSLYSSNKTKSIVKVLKSDFEFIKNADSVLKTIESIPLRKIIRKMMAYAPAERYSSCGEVILDINQKLGLGFELETSETREAYILGTEFVDRVSELDTLTRKLEKSEKRMLLVRGSFGIGKSRLFQEFKKYCQLNEFLFFNADCPENIARTYFPFIEILNQALLDASDDLVEKYGAELKKVLPNQQRFAAIQVNPTLDPKNEAGVLIENITQFLLEYALEQHQTLILVLDNLQWADEGTLGVIAEMLFKMKSEGIESLKIYASIRDEEIAHIAPTLEELRKKNRLQELVITPFDVNDVTGFIQAIFGEERIDDSLKAVIPKLHEESQGTPLNLQEMVKSLVENDVIIRSDHLKWQLMESFEQGDFPLSATSIIRNRISKLALNPEQTQCLQILSLLYDSISIRYFEKLIGDKFDVDVAQLFNQLETKEILAAEEVEDDVRYTFSQAIIRDVIQEDIDHPKAFHLYLAQRFEELYRHEIEQHVEGIAYHYARTDKRDKAIFYLEKAAEKAKGEYANERAIEYYDKLLEMLTDSEKEKRASILIKKGKLLVITGKWSKAEEIYHIALEFAEPLDDNVWFGQGNLALASLLQKKGDYDKALKYLDLCLNIFEELDRKDGVAETLGVIGLINWHRGNYDVAMTHFRRKLETAEKINDTESIIASLNNMGLVYWNQGNGDDAMNCFRKQIKIAEKAGDKNGIGYAVGNMGLIYRARGDYDKAMKCYQQKLTLSKEMGNKGEISIVLGNIGNIYLHTGEYEKALDYFEENIKLAEELGDKRTLSIVYVNMGTLYKDSKNYSEAEKCYQKSIELGKSLRLKYYLPTYLYEYADLCYLQGQYEKAEKINSEAMDIAKEQNQKDVLFRSELLSAKMLFARGDEEQKNDAVKMLNSMLEQTDNQKHKANLHYELWKAAQTCQISGEEHRQKALALYQKLYKNTPNEEYKNNIEELMKIDKNIINNRYRIIEKLGEGGMGAVYLVEDLLLAGKRLALKTIKEELLDEGTLTIFKKEFDVMTRLKHPNLARVYDFGYDRIHENYYLTMDYIKGNSLRNVLEENFDISLEEKLKIIVSLLRTLEFIHTRNILHRDVKPSNIIIKNEQLKMKNETENNSSLVIDHYSLKLMDFGLADIGKEDIRRSKGTLLYMAPEILKGEIDKRVDIFAAGVTILEFLTGEPLYKTNKTGNIVKVLKSDYQFIQNANLAVNRIEHPKLKKIVRKMIAFDPAERYGSCIQIISDINAQLSKSYPFETPETREAYVLGAGFVDRIQELTALKEGSSDKKSDSLLLIKGEIGIGKTRLFQELKKYCQLNEILFLENYCAEKVSRNFSPFLNILSEALLNASDNLIQFYAPELKKILPYHKRFAGVEANPTQDAKIERGIQINYITDFLLDYANTQKTALVLHIGDLQWADEGSLEVIKELLYKLSREENSSGQLRLYASARIESLNKIDSFLQELQAKSRIKEIELDPFRDKDIQDYMQAIFGNEVIDVSLRESVPELRKKVGGIPLRIQETVKALVEHNIIRRNEHHKWSLTQSLNEIDFEVTVKFMVKERIQRLDLSPEALECLQILSLLHNTISIEAFSQIISDTNTDVKKLFDLLEEKEILCTVESKSEIEYGFAQNVIKEIVQETITDPKDLYLYIAQRLEEIYADQIDEYLDELAYNYSRTNNREKAMEFLKRAGDHAQKSYSNQKAIEYYDQLLQLVTDEKMEIDILLEKGSVLNLIGKLDEAFELYQRALTVAKQISDDHRLARASRHLGAYHYKIGDYERAMDLYQAALEVFKKLDQKKDVATLFGNFGVLFLSQGEFDKAITQLKKGLNLNKKIDYKYGIGQGYCNIGVVYLNRGMLEPAVEYFQKLIDLGEELGNKQFMALGALNLGLIHYNRKNYEKAINFFEKSLQISEEMGDKEGISRATGNMGLIHLDSGDYEKALKYFDEAMAISKELGSKENIAVILKNFGEIHANKGNFEQALNEYNRALTLDEELGNKHGIVWDLYQIGEIKRWQRKYDEALEYFDRSLKISQEIGSEQFLGLVNIGKAEVLFQLGNYDEAKEACLVGQKFAENVELADKVFQSKLLIQKIEYAQGNRERPIENLNELLETAEKPYQQAYLHYELFKMTFDANHKEKALELFKMLNDAKPYFEYKRRMEALMNTIVGELINNRYRIIEKLGEGGMGSVYLVEDMLLAGKRLALKTIKEELLDEGTLTNFKKEFDVMTRLKHPNLARVYDFGYDRAHQNYYLTMDYIKGNSLRNVLEKYVDISLEEKLKIIVSLLRTLEFIHTRNILHRDVKPSNIIIKNEKLRMKNETQNNSSLVIDHYSLKLMDFGLADIGKDDIRRSKGTLLYMAPEILKGEIDKRVDIFAAGVTILEFLTGNLLYDSANTSDLVKILKNSHHFQSNAEKALKRIENRELRNIVRKMIAYNAADRYASSAQIIYDINETLNLDFPLETPETRESYILGANFVDRGIELQQLIRKAEKSENAHQLLMVIGGIGIGKSRLFREFRKYCQLNDIEFLQGDCPKQIPRNYFPILNILREALLNASQSLIKTYGGELKKLLPNNPKFREIKANPTQAPKTERGVIIQNITNFLLDYGMEKDGNHWALYLNDFQWSDDGTQAVISELLYKLSLEKYQDANLRVYATVRQEEMENIQPMLETLREKERIQEIQLKEFALDHVADYFRAIFGEDYISQSLKKSISMIKEKIGGVPLLLQEILKSFVEREIIARGRDSLWTFTQPLSDVDFQVNTESIIRARLRRLELSPEENEGLQILALLHDSITIDAFRNIVSPRIQIDFVEFFHYLERKEFLISRESEDRIEYSFSQTLIKDIIQHDIERSKELHQFIAERLEELYADDLEQFVEELAYNYSRTDNREKAIEYLEKAGDKAKESYANQKALGFYDKFLSLVEDKTRKIHVLFKKGSVLHVMGNWDDTLKYYKLGLELAKEIDNSQLVANALNGIGSVYYNKSEYDEALECYNQAMALFKKENNKKGIAMTFGKIGNVHLLLGENDAAMECYEKELEYNTQIGNKMGIVIPLGNMAIIHIRKGNYDKAMKHCQDWLELAEELGNKGNISKALGNMGNIYTYLGDYDNALDCFQRDLKICEEIGEKAGISLTVGNMGNVYRSLGDYDSAIACYDRGIRVAKEIGFVYFWSSCLIQKAQLQIQLERYEEARAAIQEGLPIVKRIKFKDFIQMGEIGLAQIDFAQGKEEKAIETLEMMLSDTEKKSDKADLHYNLWEMYGKRENAEKETGHREKGIELYRDVYEENANVIYKKKLDELLRGRTVINSRYQIVRKIGEGGMGAVYLVEDILLAEKQLALKTIKTEMLNANTLKSFKREFEVMTRLKHPNLARVYDFGYDKANENYYITMDFVDGVSLKEFLLQENAISMDEKLDIMVALLRTLEFIHSRDILHRDIKPGNIMVMKYEDSQIPTSENPTFPSSYPLKIMDFGLADLEAEKGSRTKGTLLYMAPEIIHGEIDHRIDIFAAGITFYELITGDLLYGKHQSKSIISTLKNEVSFSHESDAALKNISNPSLRQIIGKMIEYNPHERYQNCMEIILDINEKLDKAYRLETADTKEAYILGTSFVDRAAELSQLKNNLAEDREKILLIRGNTGIGKSRLFQEFKKYCQLNNILFLEANCLEHISRLYSPFLDILNQIILNASPTLIRKYGSDLKKIMPNAPQLKHIDANPTHDPRSERGIIVESVTDFILDYANQTDEETALYIDNLQWNDEGSFEIMEELLYKLSLPGNEAVKLSVYSSIREENVSEFNERLKNLERKRRLKQIKLTPFESDNIKNYIRAIFGNGRVDRSLEESVPYIQEDVGGVPLNLQETIKSLVESDLISRGQNFKWSLTTPWQEINLQDTIEAIIKIRLQKLELSSDEQQCVQILSLFDNGLTIAEFEEVISHKFDVNVEKVFNLLEAKEILIKENVEEKVKYIFPQAMIQHEVRNQIENPKALHQFVAERLEEIHKDNLEEHIEELVYNYLQTDLKEKKIQYLRLAFRKAKKNYANDATLEYCDRLLELLPDDQTESKIEVLYQKAHILEIVGKWDESIEYHRQIIDLAMEHELANWIGVAKVTLGKILQVKGESDESLRLIDEALDLFKKLDEKKNIAMALGGKGAAYYKQGGYAKALKYFRQQVEIAEAIDAKKEISNGVGYIGNISLEQGNYDEALACYRRKIEISEAIGDLRGKSVAIANMGVIYLRQGNLNQAMEYYQDQLEIAENTGDKRTQSTAACNIGIVYWNLSDHDKTLEYFQKYLRTAQELGDTSNIAVALGNIGEVHYTQGDYLKAQEYYERQLELSRDIGDKGNLAYVLGNLGDLYKRLKSYPEAETYYSQAIELDEELQAKYYWCQHLLGKAELYFLMKNWEKSDLFTKKAKNIAEEVDHTQIIFDANVLMAKLKFYGSDNQTDRENAVKTLKKLLEESDNKKHGATLNDELFQMTDNYYYAKAAIKLYRELYQTSPNIVYQERLKTLKRTQEKKLINHRYLITRKLGEGGMGDVFLVQDVLLGGKVLALKTIKKELFSEASLASFKREFEVMSRLKHPNLARVYDFGYDKDHDDYYITMDYVDGESLRDVLMQSVQLSVDEKLAIMVSLLRTLEFIHSRNVLHRDIKPDNIMIMNNEKLRMDNEDSQIPTSDPPTFLSSYHLKLMDFGLSDLAGTPQQYSTKGTIYYMAPEIITGQIDKRADIFAAGLIFSELMSNSLIYENYKTRDIVSVLKNEEKFVMRTHSALKNVKNRFLRNIIRKMIAYKPDDRYQNCLEVIIAINRNLNRTFELETDKTREAYVLGSSFVNRESELKRLKEKLEQSENGSEMLLIKGKMGIGKSRLFMEFRKYCQLNNIPFFQGKGRESVYKLFAPILTLLKEALLTASHQLIRSYGGELKKILPAFQRFEEITANPTQDPKAERGILIEYITQFFIDFAKTHETPIVLYLEDIQWFDNGSLDVLSELLFKLSMTQHSDSHLRIFASVQEEAMNTIDDCLTDLREKGRLNEIALTPFNEENVSDYIDSIFGEEQIDDSLKDAIPEIRQKVGGIPLILQENIKALVESDIISRKMDQKDLSPMPKATQASIPMSLQEARDMTSQRAKGFPKVDLKWALKTPMAQITLEDRSEMIIRQRLSRLKLSSAERECLNILALLDTSITIKAFEELIFSRLDVDITEFFADLEAKELLKSEDVGNRIEYGFMQNSIRDAVKERIENPQELHGFIAQRIEQLNQDNLEQYYDRLANHYSHTEEREKTLLYLEKAGEHARKNYATQKAIDYYSQLYDLLNEGQIQKKIDILLRLGRLNEHSGKWETSKEFYETALDMATKVGDKFWRAKARNSLGMIFHKKGENQEALTLFQKAFQTFEALDDIRGKSEVLGNWGNLYLRQGSYDQAMAKFQAKLDLVEELGDKHVMDRTIGEIGNIYGYKGDRQKVMEYYQKQLEIAQEIDDKFGIAMAIGNIGLVYAKGDKNYDKAMECYNRQTQICQEIGDKQCVSIALINIGSIHFWRGDYDKAMECYQQQLQISRELGDKRNISIAYINIGGIHFALGDYSKAEKFYNKRYTLAEEMGDKKGKFMALMNLADVHKMRGEYEKGKKYFEQAIPLGEKNGFAYHLAECLHRYTELLFLMENYEAAQKACQKSQKFAENLGRKDILLSGTILWERIRFFGAKTPDEKKTAIQNLKKLLENAETPFDISRISDALYRMTHERDYGTKALSLFKEIYKTNPNVMFKERIEDLEKMLEQDTDFETVEEISQEKDMKNQLEDVIQELDRLESQLEILETSTISDRYIQSILDINRQLRGEYELQVILTDIVDLMLDWLDMETAALFILNPDGEFVPAVARDNQKQNLTDKIKKLPDEIIATMTVYSNIINYQGKLFQSETEEDIIIAPLGQKFYEKPEVERRKYKFPSATQLLGILCVQDGKIENFEEKKKKISILSDLTSVALIDNHFRDKILDSFTGFYNRLYFQKRLKIELKLRQKEEIPLSVLVIDVDYLKVISRRYGKSAEEKILKILSKIFSDSLRISDIAARFSRGEFAIMLPNADIADAKHFAEKLINAVEQAEFPYGSVSISMGLSSFPDHTKDIEPDIDLFVDRLLNRAYYALQFAIEMGRSQYQIWSEDIQLETIGRDPVSDILTGDPIKDYRNVHMLLDAIGAAESTLDLDQLLDRIMDMILEITEAARGIVMLYDEDEDELNVQAVRKEGGEDIVESELHFSHSIPEEVFQSGEPVCLEDVGEEEATESMMSLQLRSIMCTPLEVKGKRFGVIYVDSNSAIREFSNADLSFFQALTSQIAGAIENARLHQAELEKERMEQELAVASKIQLSLLPDKIPQVKGLDVFGKMKTAKEVGGDYYDVILSPDGSKVYMIIGDVSGKGVPAGLFMVEVRTMIHSLAYENLSTKEILVRANRQLQESNDDIEPMFITMVLMCWDIQEQKLYYTGAGHDPIVIYRAESETCDVTDLGGVWMGIIQNVDHILDENTVALSRGDLVLLYTDGVTDLRNQDDEMYGRERLVNFITENGDKSSQEILDLLFEELSEFGKGRSQFDDITALAIKRE